MNGFIWKEIQSKKLRVIKQYKDVLRDPLTNFGTSKKKYSTFGPFYELYLYAFVIGLHENKRVDMKDQKLETFNAIYEWKRDKQDILLKFLMVLLSIDSIRQETEFNFPLLKMEDIDEDELKKIISNLINVVEQFANGGLEILYKKYADSPEDFEHYLSLKTMFDETVKKSELLKAN
jgi:hypothetical protein